MTMFSKTDHILSRFQWTSRLPFYSTDLDTMGMLQVLQRQGSGQGMGMEPLTRSLSRSLLPSATLNSTTKCFVHCLRRRRRHPGYLQSPRAALNGTMGGAVWMGL